LRIDVTHEKKRKKGVRCFLRALESLAFSPHEKQDRRSELIFACVICTLAFVAAELANAPVGWEDELGFHFGAP